MRSMHLTWQRLLLIAVIVVAVAMLTGCGGNREASEKTSWSTVWHMGKALEMGASRQHIAKGMQELADQVAESGGYELDKNPAQETTDE